MALLRPGRWPRPAGSARSRAAVGICALAAASILLGARLMGFRNVVRLHEAAPAPAPAGWATSFLHQQADPDLNARVDAASAAHRFRTCSGDRMRLGASAPWNTSAEIEAWLDSGGAAAADGGERFVAVEVEAVPCRSSRSGSCCPHVFYFRPNTTDFKVYQQVFIWHYMRYLYTLYDKDPPSYILDAGANAGFSAALFKLLWPHAVVVAVEPDPGNFEALGRQVAGVEGVHLVNAALWGRKAKVAQVYEDDGAWGKIFAAVNPDSPAAATAAQAYSVPDFASLHKLPGFDFVKIDVEGAEGQVFDPAADLSWIAGAKVLSLEVHDYFAPHFGLKDVSTRIEAAMRGRPFAIVSDNEHVMYLGPQAVEAIPAAASPPPAP